MRKLAQCCRRIQVLFGYTNSSVRYVYAIKLHLTVSTDVLLDEFSGPSACDRAAVAGTIDTYAKEVQDFCKVRMALTFEFRLPLVDQIGQASTGKDSSV